jgi:hypothetical protein
MNVLGARAAAKALQRSETQKRRVMECPRNASGEEGQRIIRHPRRQRDTGEVYQ